MKDGLVLSDVVAFSRLGAKGAHAQNAERDFHNMTRLRSRRVMQVSTPGIPIQ